MIAPNRAPTRYTGGVKHQALILWVLVGCEAPTGGLAGLPPPPNAEPSCDRALTVTRVGHLPPSTDRFVDDRAVLGPEGLYFGQRGAEGGQLAVYGTNDQVRSLLEATPAGGIRTLEGSADKVLWSIRRGDSRSPSDLAMLDAEGRNTNLGTTLVPLNPLGDGVPTPHSVDGDRASFFTLSTIEVLSTSDPTPYASLLSMTPTEPPYLRWPLLALTGAGPAQGGTQIEVYDLAQSWRRIFSVTGVVHNPVLTQDALIYLDSGNPQLTPLDAPEERRTILERTCSSLDTDGESVVLACDPEPAGVGIAWLVNNRSLWLLKDGTLRELALSGRSATLPRIKGDVVAYLSYGETDFCGGPGRGEVVVHDIQRDQTQVIAEVTQGCYCCDAFWPLPRLWLDARMIAWNYDLVPEDQMGWGLATLNRECSE